MEVISKHEYEAIDKKVEEIIIIVSDYMKFLDYDFVRFEILKAYDYAKNAHHPDRRLSGEPYIIHPVESVEFLLSLKPDLYTIQACFLHDVIEDTTKTFDDILKIFGQDVASLCLGMEKLSKVRYRGEERTIGSLRKMLLSMAEDLRVIFIKLADRLHNMKTLKFHPEKLKRERIALETLNIYAPIANRLGLFNIKNQLEEECFKILDNKEYIKLNEELNNFKNNIESFLKSSQIEIRQAIGDEVDGYELDFRVKSIYSIYKKLKRKSLKSIFDLNDLFGIRIIVEDEATCYKILGIIHSKWTPIPMRFKDYIALPKPNGYKSLHTTIIGLLKNHRKQPTEIQIKTFKMKEYSDVGIAAHFEYKEKGSKIATDISWVSELKDLIDNIGDSDFTHSLKIDIFKDRIYVFTPNGDFINLPSGSTSIDFAYYVHSDLGDHISLSKVNNNIYPLDKELNNGDVIEIVINKNKKPNPLWLGFVKTLKAKNRIKAFIKTENKEKHFERGKDMVNNFFIKRGLDVLDKELSVLRDIDGTHNDKAKRIAILEQVGNLSIKPGSIFKWLKKKEIKSIQSNETSEIKQKNKLSEYNNIVIGGEKKLDYILGDCCKKQFYKKIVAHINNKGVLTIHKRSCDILKKVNKNKLLSAYITGVSDGYIGSELELIIKNDKGILRDLSDIIFSMGINIEGIHTKKLTKNKTQINLNLELMDYDYLLIDRLIDRLCIRFDKGLYEIKIL